MFYADDLVVLCHRKEDALEAIRVLKAVFEKLELTINTKKSKLVNIWDDKEGFDFLGHHHRRLPFWAKKGKIIYYLRSYPSRKALTKMRTRIREELSPRARLVWPLRDVISYINPIIQGWKNCYAAVDPKMANRFLAKIGWYIRRRMILWWNKKHKRRKSSGIDFFELLRHAGLKSLSVRD